MLSHFFVLVVAVRRAVLMSAIDVIGKRHINTGKAKQLYALARIVTSSAARTHSRAFSRYDSRFDISHILWPAKREVLDPGCHTCWMKWQPRCARLFLPVPLLSLTAARQPKRRNPVSCSINNGLPR